VTGMELEIATTATSEILGPEVNRLAPLRDRLHAVCQPRRCISVRAPCSPPFGGPTVH
jgi:hypothetical protein